MSSESPFQPTPSSLELGGDRASRITARAESMFQRILVTWAGDVLELRRRGELTPNWAGGLHPPSQVTQPIEPMKKAA